MSSAENDIKMDILFQDFLHCEIVKRHIEEYNPEYIEIIENIKNNLCKDVPDVYRNNVFHVIVGQLISFFELTGNNKVIFDFSRDSNFIKEHIDLCKFIVDENIFNMYKELVQISDKYNVISTELLYPIDMLDILEHFDKNFNPPTTYTFKKVRNGKFRITELCGELKIFPELDPLCNLKFTIEEDDVDYLKYQYIIHKIIKGDDISTNELYFINKYEKKMYDYIIRKDSYLRYIVGLLAWDLEKESKGDDIYKFYPEYQKRNKKCNGNICKLDDDCLCDKLETCKSFINGAKRIISLCIKAGKILSTREIGSYIPPHKQLLLKRYQLSYFIE